MIEFIKTNLFFIIAVIALLYNIIIFIATSARIKKTLKQSKIIFEENYEVRLNSFVKIFNAIDNAMKLNEDDAEQEMTEIKADFNEALSTMMCVINNSKLINNFLKIKTAIENGEKISEKQIIEFKIQCRRNLGLDKVNIKFAKTDKVKNTKPVKEKKQTKIEKEEKQEEIVKTDNLEINTVEEEQVKPVKKTRAKKEIKTDNILEDLNEESNVEEIVSEPKITRPTFPKLKK